MRALPTQGMRTLLRFLRPYGWQVASLMVLGAVASLLEAVGVSLLLPVLQMLTVPVGDAGATTGSRVLDLLSRSFHGIPQDQRLQVIVGIILVLILLKNLAVYALGVATSWVRMRLERALSLRVFEQFMRVGYRFITEHSAGEFWARLHSDPKLTGVALQETVELLAALCLVVAYTGLLLMISWPLTLLAVAFLLVLSWVLHWPATAARPLGEQITQAISQLSHVTMETLGAMRLIRAFGRERFEHQRYQSHLQRMGRLQVRSAALSNLPVPLAEVLSVTCLGAFLVLMAPVVIEQRAFVLPLLLTFLFVLYRLLPRVAHLNAARLQVALYLPSAEAVARLLDPEGKPYLLSGTRPVQPLQQGIRLDRVTFAYGATASAVLRNLSLDIPAGRTTAVVGLSGGGKSTLVDLLLRFYDPDHGVIQVDGVDLRELDLAQWRAAIGVVSQDTFLFHATVRENIAYGRLEATDEAIREAARLADAHGFITALPHGYETVIGDRGVRLSAGQRQRLALARAILRDSQLLLLDEATSALDSESERQVQGALQVLRAQRTVVIVAHRLSTVAGADHIVVLRDGRVVEQGTHAELLLQRGPYHAFWKLQAGEGEPVGSREGAG